MSYKITKLCLGFENLEHVTIDGEHIKDISMAVVTDMGHIRADEVCFNENIESLFLKISEKADLEYDARFECEKSSVFERIMKYRDICNVTVHLEAEDTGEIIERNYYVPWEEQCEENLRQRTIFEGGSLTVYID